MRVDFLPLPFRSFTSSLLLSSDLSSLLVLGVPNFTTNQHIVHYGTRLHECMGSYSILLNTIVRYMHDGLWYGITVQLIQTISTYYGAINRQYAPQALPFLAPCLSSTNYLASCLASLAPSSCALPCMHILCL
jgi:hypothetical protein